VTANHPRENVFGTYWAWFRHDRERHEDQYLAPVNWNGDVSAELPIAHVKIEYTRPRLRFDAGTKGEHGKSKPDAYRAFAWNAQRKAFAMCGVFGTMAAAKDAVAASFTDRRTGARPVIERPLRIIKESAHADQ